LSLDRVTRSFDGTPAVHELSLEIAEHEIITLLGPSGCGKTTTLRMVAGFETPDAGRVLLEGREITALPAQRRGFGMVFQHYALFPHLDVGANVAFGLEGRSLRRGEREARVRAALQMVGLPGIERRSVGSLSGGQQQRVALARALAPEPRVLLLDEPLSNLDATLRERTRRELRALVKQIGITTVYVTHDQEEAFALSDRIAVMREGKLEQLGDAEALYHRPASEFAATFLGRAGSVDGSSAGFRAGEPVLCRLSGDVLWPALAPPGAALERDAALRLLARPEALEFAPAEAEGALTGIVGDQRFAGSAYIYTVKVSGGALEVQAGAGQARSGAVVAVRPRAAPQGLFAFPRRLEEGGA
jgi:ABC-type Fe3+/spermidine/putrescine transport system ATPase subunit